MSCTVTPQVPPSAERDSRPGPGPGTLAGPHNPLEPGEVSLEREPRTVEQSWLLDLYTLFHAKHYTQSRLVFRGAQRGRAVAHLLLPDGDGIHATVAVFPILAGSHVVSEALAKALISHGYAVARMERPELDLEDPSVGAREFSQAIRGAVHDARRLIDFLTRHPRVDAGRLASAGVSLGGIQALLLAATDPRIRGGFFIMAGGGLAEILWDSSEKPVRAFRERLRAKRGLETRADFVASLRQETGDVDPLTYGGSLDPSRILLASGRFDRVMPPARTKELWVGRAGSDFQLATTSSRPSSGGRWAAERTIWSGCSPARRQRKWPPQPWRTDASPARQSSGGADSNSRALRPKGTVGRQAP
ncbi:MAG: hypothetical protein V3R91_03815 [Myxococcota bacterium]